MNKKESILKQQEDLQRAADFQKDLKEIFSTPAGTRFLNYLLDLGNFGGVIKGDYDAGRNYVATQVWVEVIKAVPEAAINLINELHKAAIFNRQEQFKQLDNWLKEANDE
jgi:hypothetical protein